MTTCKLDFCEFVDEKVSFEVSYNNSQYKEYFKLHRNDVCLWPCTSSIED